MRAADRDAARPAAGICGHTSFERARIWLAHHREGLRLDYVGRPRVRESEHRLAARVKLAPRCILRRLAKRLRLARGRRAVVGEVAVLSLGHVERLTYTSVQSGRRKREGATQRATSLCSRAARRSGGGAARGGMHTKDVDQALVGSVGDLGGLVDLGVVCRRLWLGAVAEYAGSLLVRSAHVAGGRLSRRDEGVWGYGHCLVGSVRRPHFRLVFRGRPRS